MLGKKKVVIGVFLLVILAGIGIAGYTYLAPTNSDDNQAEKEKVPISTEVTSTSEKIDAKLPDGYQAGSLDDSIQISRDDTEIAEISPGGLVLTSYDKEDISASLDGASAVGEDPEKMEEVINKVLEEGGVITNDKYEAYRLAPDVLVVTHSSQ